MKSLDNYILRQIWTPFLFATAVVTGIVWLTQSLQRIDILVEHGQSLAVFGYLTVLIIPSLLSVIIPFGLFAATVFALHRLHSDSEIAVMFAAGVSRVQVARPILLVTTLGALLTLWINLDLMPSTYRELKQKIADIRADFASAVLHGGEFVKVIDGFTVYVENARPGGQFTGLLINDYRDAGEAKTYMAQRGLLRETGIGPVLYLANGNIQQVDSKSGVVDIYEFDQTAINLGDFDQNDRDLQLELTERYIGELFHPDLTRAYDRENATRLVAEGHNRLASPLYAFAYVLIGLYALIGGPYNRRGYGMRIIVACAVVGGLRILGFVLQGVAANTGVNWLIYAAPVTAIVISSVLIADIFKWRPKLPEPDDRADKSDNTGGDD